MRVLDVATGQVRDVSESEAVSGYREGAYRLQRDAEIPMLDASGQYVAVRQEGLGGALDAGFQVASQEAFARAESEALHGGLGSAALAGVEGAGRGLTLGLSEGALGAALGDDYAAAARARAEANPIASISGEVAGAVLPALVSGGASGTSLAARGARAATALPRLAARGGLAAESAVARALGEGTTALGRIGRSAISKGVGAAVEQLPSAVGHGVSTALLDRDATAEKILAQVGLETIAGGMAGSILGGATRSSAEAYQAYQALAKRVFGDATHPGVGKQLVRLSAAMSGDDPAALSRLALGDSGGGILSESARANRALAYGAEARERTVQELSESLSDTRAALSRVRVAAAREPSAVATGALDAIGKVDTADTRLANMRIFRPDAGADTDGVRSHLSQLTDPVRDQTSTAISDWMKAGDALSKVDAPPKSELGQAIAHYRAAASRANAAAAKASDAVVLTNQARALTQASGGQDSAIGLGTVASLALDSALPLAGGAALNSARSAVRALSAPGSALERLATVERLAQGLSSRLDGGLDRYLAQVSGGARVAARTASSATTRAAGASARRTYDRAREQLEAAHDDPRGLAAAVARSTRHVDADAPEVAAAVRASVARAQSYLASRMPRARQTGPWARSEPSAADIAKFAKLVSAVEDPVGTLTSELEAGTLSRETMQVIREVYPTLAAQITARVAAGVADMDRPPPYSERVRLSLLLGQPLDPSLRPEAIAARQAVYVAPPPHPPQSQSDALSGVADAYETSAERATE